MVYQSEIEKLEQRYRENPQQWFAALADSYRKAGDLELAIEVVRVGLEKRPNYVSGHIVKGRCLIDQKKDADAAVAFQRVLELDAENVIALKALSEISERAGGLDDARRWLTRLLEVDPMNEDAQEALSHLPAAAKTEPAPTPTPTPTPTPINPLADVATLVETPAAPPVEERPSGKGFVIEKAEEAIVDSERAAMAEMETLEFTPPADEPPPLAELASMEFTPPEEAPAEPPGGPLDIPEEAEPESAPAAADAGELRLIFPEDVAAVREAESVPEPEGDPEPEPVVTETMAELYAKQGLLSEARGIYRQLVARHPGDGALARRLAELEAVPTVGPPRRSSGRVIAAGGPTVRDFLGEVFSGRPPALPEPQPEPQPPSPMEAAFAEPAEDVRGAPTRRASDEVSLSSVFGEEPSPVNPRPSGTAATPEQDKKFSFDEFFGGAPPKAPKPRAAEADAEKERGSDEDDFKRWLKGLKS